MPTSKLLGYASVRERHEISMAVREGSCSHHDDRRGGIKFWGRETRKKEENGQNKEGRRKRSTAKESVKVEKNQGEKP